MEWRRRFISKAWRSNWSCDQSHFRSDSNHAQRRRLPTDGSGFRGLQRIGLWNGGGGLSAKRGDRIGAAINPISDLIPIMLKEEGYRLMGAAFEVYNELGYGMAEEVYQQSVEIELELRSIPFQI